MEKCKHMCIIKLKTERFQRGDTYFSGKSLRVMKRLSRGYNMLREECSLIGVHDFFNEFHISVEDLEDGLYVLDYAGFWTDWETGHREPEGYTLTPYKSDEEVLC